MTKNDINTLLPDLQGWEGLIGRKLRFKKINEYDTDRAIFSIEFETSYFRHDNPQLDISSFFGNKITRLTATDFNFVDEQGNDVEKIEITPAELDEEGNVIKPAVMGYPEGAVNEHDFWIYGVLSGQIVFWDIIYQAMMRRVEEGFFD